MFRIVRASALVFALASAASAGETPNNVTDGTTRPLVRSVYDSAADAGFYEGTADSFGETLLNLFESVLALL
jgi:hypothetical protein